MCQSSSEGSADSCNIRELCSVAEDNTSTCFSELLVVMTNKYESFLLVILLVSGTEMSQQHKEFPFYECWTLAFWQARVGAGFFLVALYYLTDCRECKRILGPRLGQSILNLASLCEHIKTVLQSLNKFQSSSSWKGILLVLEDIV